LDERKSIWACKICFSNLKSHFCKTFGYLGYMEYSKSGGVSLLTYTKSCGSGSLLYNFEHCKFFILFFFVFVSLFFMWSFASDKTGKKIPSHKLTVRMKMTSVGTFILRLEY